MPKLAQKAKALSGKGSVVSYAHEPTKFYFRELIAGTKNYQSQLIKGAETLDEALEKCIDAYTALRQVEKLFGGRELSQLIQTMLPCSRLKTKVRAESRQRNSRYASMNF